MKDFLSRLEADPLIFHFYQLVKNKFTELKDPDPGHDLSHFLRVALWTTRLAGPSVDFREAVLSALLHDIVPVPKNSPLRREASRLCAEESEKLLEGSELSRESRLRISEAIRCHSFSRGEVATSPLAQALQDADRLEALGSLGIMRCISTGMRMGAEYFDGADPWAEGRARDDRRYSVDHFFTKLLKLPKTMNTDAGRREAQKRVKILEEFLVSLGEELGQPLGNKWLTEN